MCVCVPPYKIIESTYRQNTVMIRIVQKSIIILYSIGIPRCMILILVLLPPGMLF